MNIKFILNYRLLIENYIMKNEIEIIECNSIEDAENEYFKRRSEGCWQMVKAIKIHFSWRKFRTVARFSMKKVDKPYHFDDYLLDFIKASVKACELGIDVSKTILIINKHKSENKNRLKSI